MVITTRGGKARVLEYDKNYELISKEQSHKRIETLQLISNLVFGVFLQILIIIFIVKFDSTHRPTWQETDIRLVPKLNTYIFSMSENFVVNLYPTDSKLQILQDSKRALRFQLPPSLFVFAYEYNQRLNLIYGNYEPSKSTNNNGKSCSYPCYSLHFLFFSIDCSKPWYLVEEDEKCVPKEGEVKNYTYFFQIGSGKAAERKQFGKIKPDSKYDVDYVFRIHQDLSPLLVQVGPRIWLHGEIRT